VLLLVVSGAQAMPFSNIYLLGDSLSDTGNTRAALGPLGGLVSIAAGYGANGRFSNGPVWHEYLAGSLGLPAAGNSLDGGNNYAFGGARVDNATGVSAGVLTQQASYFADLGPSPSDPDALFITWAGGNDMRDLVGNASPLAAIDSALDQLTGVIGNLISSGASTLLVPNLPDLGRIPEFASSANAASASAVTNSWNSGLLSRMSNLAAMTSANIFFLDVFSLFDDLLSSPATFGFSNTTDECRSVTTILGVPVAENECANADQFVFWDEIHPTTAAHELLGDSAFALLSQGNPLGFDDHDDTPEPMPLPATAILFLLGGVLIVRRRPLRPRAA
jgi:phospholipase/lecithinase/hemolysin